MLADEGLTTAKVSGQVAALQADLLARIGAGEAGAISQAELLNPLAESRPHARFLAFRHPDAQAWKAALMARDVVTDVRDDVLRIGLGLYHDADDIERFCAAARAALRS